MVPLTPLTSKTYTSTIFLSCISLLTPLTSEKHEEKYFKKYWFSCWWCRWHYWHQKLYINHFFSCISSLTLLTSEKIWREIFQKRYWFNCWWCRWHQKIVHQLFFLVFHRWHRWRLKVYKEKYFKRDAGLFADGAVDTLDIRKLSITHFFFLYFTADTVDVWKNMKNNISKEILV